MLMRMKSCRRTLLKHRSSSETRSSAENHAEEDDRASGDVLPEGGDVQKHQRLLEGTEQQDAQECAQQAAASSQNIRAAKNDGGDDGEFVAICSIALDCAELRGIKHRADGRQYAK